MRKLLTILAGGTLWLLVLTTAAGAGVLRDLGSMTVDPDSGPAGTTFTVSGDGCGYVEQSVGQQAIETVYFVDLWFQAGTQTASVFVTSDDGSWSHEFTVPDGTEPGTYEITANCMYGYDTSEKVQVEPEGMFGKYDDGTFTVTEPVATTVAPTTVPVTVASTVAPTAAPVTQAAPATAELPRTGADLGLLAAGSGMLLAGGAAFVAGRRRNHH